MAADRGNWSINDAPRNYDIHNPSPGSWVGKNMLVHASWIDPDTRVSKARVSIDFGNGCTDQKDVTLNTASSGTYVIGGTPMVHPNAVACILGVDELNAEATGLWDDVVTPMVSQAFNIDTEAPSSTTAVTFTPTTPTRWTISWAANDGTGSGFTSVTVYEKKPGGTWLVLTTSTSAEDSVDSGYTVGGKTGSYCYATVARDNVGNVESGPLSEACLSYPV